MDKEKENKSEEALKKAKDKTSDPKIKSEIDKKLKYVNNQFNK